MNQEKMGSFLKELRRERGITQEQLAEKLNVSGRTVSRWETGNNLPDLSLLVEIADFYDVDIREIINAERKSEKMNEDLKDTLEVVAEYSNDEKKKLKKKMLNMSAAAGLLLLFAALLMITEGFGVIPEEPCDAMTQFAVGFAIAIYGINMLYLLGVYEKYARKKLKIFKKLKK